MAQADLPGRGWGSGEGAPASHLPLAAADRALELDPNSSAAHKSRGIVQLALTWNRPSACREFERSLEIKPSAAHHWYAHYLIAPAGTIYLAGNA